MKSLFYIVVLYTFLAAHPASGQYIEDPYLYYSVGGGRAISPPASNRVYSSVRMSASPDSAAEILIRSSTSAPCWEASATRLSI